MSYEKKGLIERDLEKSQKPGLDFVFWKYIVARWGMWIILTRQIVICSMDFYVRAQSCCSHLNLFELDNLMTDNMGCFIIIDILASQDILILKLELQYHSKE